MAAPIFRRPAPENQAPPGPASRRMNKTSPKTLILGLVAGLSLEQTRPFFLSLEKAGYRGDVCLFVQDLAPETVAFLRARRVNLVPFQKSFLKPKWTRLVQLCRPFLKPRARRLLTEHWLLACLHMHCARQIYFRTYLAECGRDYDYAMLADIRDVLFQKDPFAFEIPDGLCVFQEDARQTIGTNFSNASWMRDDFGPAVLNELRDKPVFCAGVIFGPPAALLEYLEQVLQIFCARSIGKTFDQATHNVIVHQQPPPALHRFDNDTGPVLTMARMDPGQFRFNDAGFLVNQTGRIFNTLHQYDRHPELIPKLLRRLT
jgi:hypothetical protein